MKKQLIITILGFVLTQNIFAEQSMSKLEHVKTQDCSYEQIKVVIRQTADRVMYVEKDLSVIEEALSITKDQKNAGIKVEITGVQTQFIKSDYDKEVSSALKTVQKAATGKVVIVRPRTYNIFFEVQNKAKEGSDDETVENRTGKIQALITCRIEKSGRDNKNILTTARLISFDILE